MWNVNGNKSAKAEWKDLAVALGRLLWQVLQLVGNIAFLALQFFMAFMLGFAAVMAGLLGAGRRRR